MNRIHLYDLILWAFFVWACFEFKELTIHSRLAERMQQLRPNYIETVLILVTGLWKVFGDVFPKYFKLEGAMRHFYDLPNTEKTQVKPDTTKEVKSSRTQNFRKKNFSSKQVPASTKKKRVSFAVNGGGGRPVRSSFLKVNTARRKSRVTFAETKQVSIVKAPEPSTSNGANQSFNEIRKLNGQAKAMKFLASKNLMRLLVHIISGCGSFFIPGFCLLFGYYTKTMKMALITSDLIHQATIVLLLRNHDGAFVLRPYNLALAVTKLVACVVLFHTEDPKAVEILFAIIFVKTSGFAGTRLFCECVALIQLFGGNYEFNELRESWYSYGLFLAQVYTCVRCNDIPWFSMCFIVCAIRFPQERWLCKNYSWQRRFALGLGGWSLVPYCLNQWNPVMDWMVCSAQASWTMYSAGRFYKRQPLKGVDFKNEKQKGGKDFRLRQSFVSKATSFVRRSFISKTTSFASRFNLSGNRANSIEPVSCVNSFEPSGCPNSFESVGCADSFESVNMNDDNSFEEMKTTTTGPSANALGMAKLIKERVKPGGAELFFGGRYDCGSDVEGELATNPKQNMTIDYKAALAQIKKKYVEQGYSPKPMSMEFEVVTSAAFNESNI